MFIGAFVYWTLAESNTQLIFLNNPLEKKRMLTSATSARF